ncbi:hypothetical protein HAX54_000958 [Datura stramonium]|uniref:Uncharacterized protein n=1 Tax=Datura stramonium TaxID=4076 RepID=A0ABS8T2J0_DATST|nr:hypothetical protein [Datura stramonium]
MVNGNIQSLSMRLPQGIKEVCDVEEWVSIELRVAHLAKLQKDMTPVGRRYELPIVEQGPHDEIRAARRLKL